MRVALVGAPASGKTSLAKELALHLPDLQVSDAPSPEPWQPGPYARVLLMGLDLPGITPAQLEADARLRAQLATAGLAYGVVYGQGAQRLRAALRLIEPQDGPPPRWTGLCEKCADPDCEFKTFMFTKLTQSSRSP